MNEHLNADAMDRYLAGERDAPADDHLRECAQCREAASRVETALRQFGAGIEAWSDKEPLARPPAGFAARAETAASRWWIAPARWAAVATAALLLAAVPVYRSYSRQQSIARARADALLLEQVSADLSRPAPEALEPLINLVSQSNTGDNR